MVYRSYDTIVNVGWARVHFFTPINQSEVTISVTSWFSRDEHD